MAPLPTENPEDRRIDWPLFVPLFLASIFVQIVVPTARVATSYAAVEIGLDAAAIGLISAAFALLPVFIAIPLGRFNDRGNDAISAFAGSVVILSACLAFLLLPPSFANFLIITSALGLGQILLMSALQVIATRCSGPASRDTVLGNYMVALSIGNGLGPLLLLWGDPNYLGALASRLYLFGVWTSVVLVITSIWFLALRKGTRPDGSEPSAALSSVLKTPGLFIVLVASSLTITANDLVLIYLPVLGAERAIAPATIGLLLSARAITAMASRLFFASMVRRLGRRPLVVAVMVIAALSSAGFAFHAPFWVLMTCSVLSGFSLGIAATSLLSLTVEMSPIRVRATALSLRLAATRVGQFAIPAAAGLVAGLLGTGSIFLLIGASIGLSGLGLRKAFGKS